MKRANFTLFQPQTWMSKLGQSALAVLFVWCCMGIQTAAAQTGVTDTIRHPMDIDDDGQQDTTGVYKIEVCEGANVLYTDDNTGDGELYYDNHQADFTGFTPFSFDTLEICPEDEWHAVTVTFTDFDLHPGDFLDVWDGDTAAVNARTADFITFSNGTGPSSIGGWVGANCNPATNPSGCLTFVFWRNGDNQKGTGWEAWVTCEERVTEIRNEAIPDVDLSCLSPFGPGGPAGFMTIPVPPVFTCGGLLPNGDLDGEIRIIITNQQGDTCLNEEGVRGDVFGFNPEPGIYNVEYTLLADPSDEKKQTDRFAAQLPNLVCNDNLNIPFGSACAVQILPDFLLEDPCDNSNGFDFNPFLAYDITVYLGDTEIETTITFNGDGNPLTEDDSDNLDFVQNPAFYSIEYPSITKEDLAAAGIDVCDNNIRVKIERVNNYWAEVYTGPALPGTCPVSSIRTNCESYFNIYDQTAPIFTSGARDPITLIACDAAGLAELIDNPDVVDNCDSFSIAVTYTGLDQLDDVCFERAEIQIVYTATDACMNVSTPFTQDVVIVRPGPEYVTDVPSDTLECNATGDNGLKPGLAVGRLVDGEFEPTDTVELFEDRYECGYILTSRDVTVPAPDCGEKVFRYWSVLDWCDPVAPSAVDTQFILYTDSAAPEFDDSEYTEDNPLKIPLGPFECSTTDVPGIPSADDECAGDVSDNVRVIAIEQLVDSVWTAYTEDAYTCDTFRIQYAVADDCHTQELEDTTFNYFIVEDVTPPSAICTDELNVSIGSGAVRITGDDLNAGSFDACDDELDLKVRIKGTTEWLDEVALTCEHKPYVEVELQVTADKGEPVVCWSRITVEDKIRPICNPLEDASEDCTTYHPDQYGETGELVAGTELADFYNDNFGNPFDGCSDNCGITEYNQSIIVNRGDCGEITVYRIYNVEDWANLASPADTQVITVNQVHDFKLSFPGDQEVKCSDENQDVVEAWDLDDILTENNGCDVFALEVTEREFTVAGDFCKKIERTYEVINWCTYIAGSGAQEVPHDADGNAMVLNNDTITATSGRFVYTQIIKYSVDQAPEVAIDDVPMCINSGCSEMKTFSASAVNCLDKALTDFTHILRVDGEVVTTEEDGKGDSFDYPVVPGVEYEVEFWGFDDCGNSDGAVRTFTFMDCVRPTPYVLNGLAVEIMQTKEIQVWANDLDNGSFDNCPGEVRIRMALGTPDEGPGKDTPGADILELPTALTFDCNLLGTQFVSIYVVDKKGNWDVVGTYIFVQDNLGVCESDAMGLVAGKVTNAFGENVELVNVSVNGSDNKIATDATGEFTFDLPLAGDYTITPEKNINPLNGVSTFDLVLISKHILGLQKFDSPYKYIAADVNRSGSITAFDMVQLRQLILNVTSEFPNNTSWRFVDAKHEFTSENPAAENFDEFMSINNLTGQMLDVNFIAAKVGDVNGTATANSLLGAESRNINGTLSLNATDRLIEAGQTVTVDFTAADIATAQGYQFTMDFAGLDLVELKEGVAKAANFNTNLSDRGILTTSWNGEATANEVLFSLTFTASTSGLLSELVSVNSELTVAEAYNNAGELMNVALDFNATSTAAAFGLEQNTPNPFNGETIIGFNLPEAGQATLKVMDVQGKVLTAIEKDGIKGYNQVTINAKTLGATGVLYYQLESSDNIATKKMIIID